MTSSKQITKPARIRPARTITTCDSQQPYLESNIISSKFVTKEIEKMCDLKDPALKPAPEGHRWILFVSGPTASGKTSIAKFIAEKLNLKFVEGDDVRVLNKYPNSTH
jgi:Cdc6-like AAA superfamily ATPase